MVLQTAEKSVVELAVLMDEDWVVGKVA